MSDPVVRTEAAHALQELIETVTIMTADVGAGVSAEIASSTSKLAAFAANENNPLSRGSGGCATVVVAGVGFEPTTFRL